MYYLSARKVHLFGIQDEAVCKQVNYVLIDNELFGKGPNGTLSLVFDGIKQMNRGEKRLKISCDNAGGQNKNNTTLWFYLYLVIDGNYIIINHSIIANMTMGVNYSNCNIMVSHQSGNFLLPPSHCNSLDRIREIFGLS